MKIKMATATAGSSKKRKRSVLTLEMKLGIVHMLEKGPSQLVLFEHSDLWAYRKLWLLSAYFLSVLEHGLLSACTK